MHAAEVWAVVALVLGAASAGLCAIAPRAAGTITERVASGLVGAALAAIAVALWIAL